MERKCKLIMGAKIHFETKETLKMYLYAVLVSAVYLVVALNKCKLGMHSDEVFSISLGHMFSQESKFFVDCWTSLQLSSVFTYPVTEIFLLVFGSTQGILLFFRILAICVQLVISLYFYMTFANERNWHYVLVSMIVYLLYTADFASFTYKQEVIWFVMLQIISCYKLYVHKKRCYVILLGVWLSCCVLAYPTTVILCPVYFIIFCLIDKENAVRLSAELMIICGICAFIFLGSVISQIGVDKLIENFPKMLHDENLDTNWITKLVHPIGKHIILGIIALLPIVVCQKVEIVKKIFEKYGIPLVAILYSLAFFMQAYVQRRGITWHCITYAYALSLFFLIFWKNTVKAEMNEVIRIIFLFPTIGLIFAFSIASNQGNITSMYAGIFPTMAILLLLPESKGESVIFRNEKESRAVAGTLLIISLLTYTIPVYEQEATTPELMKGHRTWFSERTMVEEGPAQGIELGEISYRQYNEICEVIDSYVRENDKLCIIDSSYVSSYGYLKANCEYSTYSPYGGFGIGLSTRIGDFFRQNDYKKPTVVLINMNYVQMSLYDYMSTTDFGTWLTENNYYLIAEDNGYVVMR